MSTENKRGRFNSSKTRVFPVFETLVKTSGGIEEFLHWISKELRPIPDFSKVVSVRFEGHKDYDGKTGERGFYPSFDLLRWLLDCDDVTFVRMRKNAPRKQPVSTMDRRDWLFSPDMEQRMKIREEIPSLFDSCRKEWYVLEGATKPDVTIETDTFILVIEGKRTEPHLTDSTTWMKHRDQMIRHLDGVYEYVRKKNLQKKVLGLFIIAERDDVAFTKYNRPIPNYKMCKYGGGKYRRGSGKSCWEESLPHRSPAERAEMQDGFIGFVTWADIKKRWRDIEYPEVVND